MSNKATIRALLILFALSLSAAAQPQTITGKVVGVSDGDTITVLGASNRQHKVRLIGIDAPESNQDYGSRAKQSLLDLVFGKTVTVISSKEDRYGVSFRQPSLASLNGSGSSLLPILRNPPDSARVRDL